jgi:hypothetical protein
MISMKLIIYLFTNQAKIILTLFVYFYLIIADLLFNILYNLTVTICLLYHTSKYVLLFLLIYLSGIMIDVLPLSYH